jgi:hypothetical protein
VPTHGLRSHKDGKPRSGDGTVGGRFRRRYAADEREVARCPWVGTHG